MMAQSLSQTMAQTITALIKNLSDEEKFIKAIKENPRITIVEVMNC